MRQLAIDLQVNWNTIARAYRLLDEAGLISTQRGRGTFIWEVPSDETTRRLHQQTLEGLTRHYLAEAARLGVSPQEVVRFFHQEDRGVGKRTTAARKRNLKNLQNEVTMKHESFSINKPTDKLHINGIAIFVAVVLYLAAILGAMVLDLVLHVADGWIGAFVVVMILLGLYFLFAIKVASQWEKAVILRFGKFHKMAGPGLFWIIPLVDTLATWIDHRVMVTPFSAEKTLTKDTVPVDVDAVLVLDGMGCPKGRPGSGKLPVRHRLGCPDCPA